MHRTPLFFAISASIGVIGCAAVDGIKSKASDFSDMEASMGDSRGLEPFDGPSPRRESKPDSEGKSSVRTPLVAPKKEAGPVLPRPDGPTMEVHKSRACATALEEVAADGNVSPRTRALASNVLRCDGVGDRYDIRHAPCSLFQAPQDDRAVDASIQELRAMALTCTTPST
jgi:hypothetical protein